MKKRLNPFQTIILLILVFTVFSLAQKNSSKRLYGNIHFGISAHGDTENEGVIPYRSFIIELSEIRDFTKNSKTKKCKTLHKTNPDLRGYFSFKGVPEGKYSLSVVYFNPFGDEGVTFKTAYKEEVTIEYDKKGMKRLKTIDIYVMISEKKYGDTKSSQRSEINPDGV